MSDNDRDELIAECERLRQELKTAQETLDARTEIMMKQINEQAREIVMLRMRGEL